jgi:hypothetical protein
LCLQHLQSHGREGAVLFTVVQQARSPLS